MGADGHARSGDHDVEGSRQGGTRGKAHAVMWYVYGLIDPRSGRVFYIGMTYDMRLRLSQHSSCQESAAWETIQAIKKEGGKVIMCEFATLYSEESARRLEDHLIMCLPDILNRTHHWKREVFSKKIHEKRIVGDVDADGSIRVSEEEFNQCDLDHLPDEAIEDGFIVSSAG